VAGISKVGALKRTTEVVEHRVGGDPSTVRRSPGQSKYEAISLERGVTHDRDFEQWANKIWNWGSGLGAEVSLKDFRKDIIIEMMNEAGQVAIAYKFIAVGFPNLRLYPNSMPVPMRSQFKAFSFSMKVGSEIMKLLNQLSPHLQNPPD
jgi:phage tail-like protein